MKIEVEGNQKGVGKKVRLSTKIKPQILYPEKFSNI